MSKWHTQCVEHGTFLAFEFRCVPFCSPGAGNNSIYTIWAKGCFVYFACIIQWFSLLGFACGGGHVYRGTRFKLQLYSFWSYDPEWVIDSPCDMSLKICHLQNEENDTYLEDQEAHHVRGLGTKMGASGQSLDCLSCRQPVCFSLPAQGDQWLLWQRTASAPLDGEGIFCLEWGLCVCVCILPLYPGNAADTITSLWKYFFFFHLKYQTRSQTGNSPCCSHQS